MNTTKKLLAILLALAMVLCFAACGKDEDADNTASDSSSYVYGEGLAENGFFEGVKATDYIKLADFSELKATQSDIDSQIQYFLSSYPDSENVYEGVVEEGDDINIAFTGYIDGEAFDGGSSTGYDLTLGSGSMIPGFEEGIIGHSVGETFNVDATFTEDYGSEELNGKTATFEITINYIVDYKDAQLSDEFVLSNLYAPYGWKTVQEMKDGIKVNLALDNLYNESEIGDVPQNTIDYQMNALVNYYKQYATALGTSFETFLTSYVGVADEAALRENAVDYATSEAQYYVFLQAIAETQGLETTEDDVKEYFEAAYGDSEDVTYEDFVNEFGMPYLKCTVLNQVIKDALLSKVVLE